MIKSSGFDADQNPMDRRYGIVLGQGRCGTNWITDCLDASPSTFCRNEPDVCIPSTFDRLGNNWRIGANGAELAQHWDGVVEQAATLMGERDHRLVNPKAFVHPTAQRLGLAQLSGRPRLRKMASLLVWPWADGEWKMPSWIGNLDDPNIFALFKLVQGYNWATWVLDHRPDVPVLQVVRHPGGRHDSFLRRYISMADPETTRRAKIEQLRTLAPETSLAERMGPVDELTLAEAETWFGVYQMEVFEQRAQGSPRYLRITYEDMVKNPGRTLEQIFDHFELPLTNDVRSRIEDQRKSSVFGPVLATSAEQTDGWRDRLDPETSEQILNILTTSPIAAWWDEDSVEQQRAA